MKLNEILELSPVIAAIKDENGLEECLKTDCNMIFILYGTIYNIAEIVDRIKQQGKTAIVHMDFIAGLSSKETVVEFIQKMTRADGIISTKPHLVKKGKEIGLISIQRTFLVDSIALNTLKKQIELTCPDAIEIMPGIMPSILRKVREYTNIPIISSGLLSDKKDVVSAISAGADAVSTTKQELWYI